MRLVVLGDIHFYRLLTAPWNLIGKRALGSANLWLRRRHIFSPAALGPTLGQAAALQPDLCLFTGDLTTTALAPEFADVRRVLQPLLDAFPTVIVPGNHDRYTRTAARQRRIESFFPDQVPHTFPAMRELAQGWRLLLIDSAVPRRFNARGRCGAEQLKCAHELIADTPPDENLIVMCHYPAMLPPWIDERPGHRLDDAPALCEVLAAAAPRHVVFLHGHIHRPWFFRPGEESLRHVTFVNAGAPCHLSKTYPYGQGFWETELDDERPDSLRLRHHVPRDGERWEVDQDHVFPAKATPESI